MIKGAKLRMTNTSFPQELRLQVMKASVAYHAPTFNISPTTHSNTDDFVDACVSLFDTHPTDGALYDILKGLAEQAFLESAIFKLRRCLSPYKEEDMHSTAPLLEEVGERVHHLELIARTYPAVSCKATVKEATKIWTELKRHCPNLKVCVLTVVFQSCKQGKPGLDHPDHYIIETEEPFPEELLRTPSRSGGRGGFLGNTLTALFYDFAEKGPGVRRFVRIQHLRGEEEKELKVTPHFGPLVKVHSASGSSMLTEAYQHARTGASSLHKYMDALWADEDDDE